MINYPSIMRIIRHYSGNIPESVKHSVITLGNFDGVHKGHKAIIEHVKYIAKEQQLPSALMTFEPHPLKILRPDDSKPFRITPFHQKARLLQKTGIDYLLAVKFNQNFSEVTAEEFVEKILFESLNVKHIIIGHDFIFGHKRQGNVDFLREKSGIYMYDLTEMPQIGDTERFSSTGIRRAIRDGKILKAESMLGHPFEISGRVQKGDQRGRQIGFPTANINLGEYVRPKFGVYACEVEFAEKKGETLNAIANVGKKPTFFGERELLEVYIFNFNKDIYGKKLHVRLKQFIRDERKFSGEAELKAQIIKDIEQAKLVLEGLNA